MISWIFCKYRHKFIYFIIRRKCDFIIHDKDGVIAIQVSHTLNDHSRSREIGGLENVIKKLPVKKAIILTYNQEDSSGEGVSVIPFWKYFSGFDFS